MGIILRWKNFDYMFEIDIIQNEMKEYSGVLGVIFEGLGV